MNNETRHPNGVPSPAGPVSQGDRIVSLDVVRGFALLGILVMNIQSFSMIAAAYFNPTAYGDLEGVNYFVWLASHVLADQKFMTIFSMLFGAGVVLMADRVEAAGRRPGPIHYRRMLVLLVIGLAHAYLLWYGDILVPYALTAMITYLFRRRSPKTLIALGLLFLGIGSSISVASGLTFENWPNEVKAALEEDWAPAPEVVAEELDAYRGSWLHQMRHRVPHTLEFQTMTFFFWALWRVGGLMLIGMALFKLKLFELENPRRFALPAGAVAVFVGVPIVLLGVMNNTANGWSVGYSFWFGMQYNYWGSLLVSLGWIGFALWLGVLPAARKLCARLAAVGQAALSNYLLQTALCVFLFYGHGFGLFGEVDRLGQILVVLAVWTVQLIVTPWWLTRYRFGPVEWLWRSATYGRLQPIRRR
ncbi:MAG: DUF418 domain-containing protein [Thermoanaerobaculia bacterium]|nr:DUF418 domain-containing protein [Thermoanaerobaculia bacterium]